MQSYHMKTFNLLGIEPAVSKIAVFELERMEKRLKERVGIELPPSVHEWYSHPDCIRILRLNGYLDHIFYPDEFRVFKSEFWRIYFKDGNESVYKWSIELDGTEDPPVFASDTYHIYSRVWDHSVMFTKPFFVQAQNGDFSNRALKTLQMHFDKEIRTYGWPGDTEYRFVGDGATILIWSAQSGHTDWMISADDTESLRSALEKIWDLDRVGNALYTDSDEAKRVLENITAQSRL